MLKEHAFVIYEVLKCHDDIRDTSPLDPDCDPDEEECEPVDPPCATMEEINEYIDTKLI